MKTKFGKKYFSVRKCRVTNKKNHTKIYKTKKSILFSKNVKEANAIVDLLNLVTFKKWQSFQHQNNEWKTEFMHSSFLDSDTRNWAFDLCKQNVKHMYEAAGGWDEEKKLKEMTEEAARFILLRDTESKELVAFSHFRFDLDYGEEVLYCYELHVVPEVQRKGIGKFLLDLLEALAFTYKMNKVILTVFTANESAINFYSKCGYKRDRTSPTDRPYLILSKYVHDEETEFAPS